MSSIGSKWEGWIQKKSFLTENVLEMLHIIPLFEIHNGLQGSKKSYRKEMLVLFNL